ncbi:hypothetical protein FACS1894156_5250 [Bacteroidia bacterium]|nr:hypothetical protein FACS1894156_5250 [Bacteroidia bacterium]
MSGCTDCDCGAIPWKINPNIVNLQKQYPQKFYLNHRALWLNDSTLFAVSYPFARIVINKDFLIARYEKISDEFCGDIAFNPANDRIILSTFKEYDLNTCKIEEIDTFEVASAMYYKGNDTIIYGTSLGEYYMYNRYTKESEYICSGTYRKIESLYSMNGFDIHPQQNKLLISVDGKDKTVLMVEYDMDIKQADTLDILFPTESAVWFRYNKTGDKILYAVCVDKHSFVDSEIGIIDIVTMQKRVLDVNTSTIVYGSVNINPEWSPDERHIVYTSYRYALCFGGLSDVPDLCILKNINQ